MIKPLPSNKDFHIFPLRLDRDTITLVDQYAETNEIKTRTQAIVALIKQGVHVTSDSAN